MDEIGNVINLRRVEKPLGAYSSQTNRRAYEFQLMFDLNWPEIIVPLFGVGIILGAVQITDENNSAYEGTKVAQYTHLADCPCPENHNGRKFLPN